MLWKKIAVRFQRDYTLMDYLETINEHRYWHFQMEKRLILMTPPIANYITIWFCTFFHYEYMKKWPLKIGYFSKISENFSIAYTCQVFLRQLKTDVDFLTFPILLQIFVRALIEITALELRHLFCLFCLVTVLSRDVSMINSKSFNNYVDQILPDSDPPPPSNGNS